MLTPTRKSVLVTTIIVIQLHRQRSVIHFPHSDHNDLFDVCSELESVAAKWEGIGSALGLLAHFADDIKSNCKNVNECLRATLKKWLNKNYDTIKHGQPSWKQLTRAVSHSCGGENCALAEEIAKRHKGIEINI